MFTTTFVYEKRTNRQRNYQLTSEKC